METKLSWLDYILGAIGIFLIFYFLYGISKAIITFCINLKKDIINEGLPITLKVNGKKIASSIFVILLYLSMLLGMGILVYLIFSPVRWLSEWFR